MVDSVGVVYVRAITDTSSMKKEIENAAAEAGGKGSQAFGHAWQKSQQKRADDLLFNRAVRQRAKAMAEKLGKDIAEAERDGYHSVNFNISDEMAQGFDEINKAFGRSAQQGKEAYDKYFFSALGPATDKAVKDLERLSEAQVKEENRVYELRLKNNAAIERIETSTINKLNALERSERDKTISETLDTYDELEKELKKLIVLRDTPVKRKSFFDDRDFNVTGNIATAFSKLEARGIGKGILNTITNLIRTVEFAQDIFVGAMKKMGSALSDLGAKMTEVGGIAGKFGGVMASVGSALSVAAGPIGLVIAATAVTGILTALGALATLLSPLLFNLAAGATLAAGALASAASAGAVLVPVLASLGVGLAVAAFAGGNAATAFQAMVGAITSGDADALEKYNEALKKLGPNAREAVKAAEPLVRALAGTRKEAEKRMFDGMAESIKQLGPVVDIAKQAILGISEAVGNVIDKFFQLGSDTTFVSNLEKLLGVVSPIITNIGGALTNIFAGLTNFFAALSPLAVKFSESVGAIAQRFRDWTASAEGQTSIQNFFQNAYTIATKVMGIIATVAKIFGALVLATQKPAGGEGKGFLDTIQEKLDEWSAWIDSHGPEIQTWFERAATFAKNVAEEIGKLVKKFSDWNTDENQEKLNGLVNAVSGFLSGLMSLFEFMGDSFDRLMYIINPIIDVIGFIVNAVQVAIGAVGAFFGVVANVVGVVIGAVTSAVGAVVGVIVGIFNGIAGIVSAFVNNFGIVWNILYETILGPFIPVIDWIYSYFITPIMKLIEGVIEFIKITFAMAYDFIIKPFADFIAWLAGTFWGGITGLINGVIGFIKGVWDTLVSILTHPFDALITALVIWPGNVISFIADIPDKIGDIWDGLKDMLLAPFEALVNYARDLPNKIGGYMGKVWDKMTPDVNIPFFAEGGIVNRPTVGILGEAGPEAVIPLNRPLHLVNPQVREMARMLRSSNPQTTNQRTVNVTQHITPVQSDPNAVAMSVLNRAAVLARG